jgi:hypothetical protein
VEKMEKKKEKMQNKGEFYEIIGEGSEGSKEMSFYHTVYRPMMSMKM